MYKELSICRAIMRLYSFCDFDEESHRIKVCGAHETVASYFEIESEIKNALDSVGIEMYPTGVYSCFDSENKIALEVFFIHSACSIEVPAEILLCLSSLLKNLGRELSPVMPQTLSWAYSGRVMDRSYTQRFVTDGLQMSDNRILIDFLTYSIASHDSLHHRIIHELLHTLGIEEEEMRYYTIPACIATYEVAKPFIEQLLNQTQEINQAFAKSMQDFRRNFPELEKQLIQIGDNLCIYGFPERIDSPMYTTTFLPSKFFPEPDVTGYNVLFM